MFNEFLCRMLSQEAGRADANRHYGFYIDGDIAKLPGGKVQTLNELPFLSHIFLQKIITFIVHVSFILFSSCLFEKVYYSYVFNIHFPT